MVGEVNHGVFEVEWSIGLDVNWGQPEFLCMKSLDSSITIRINSGLVAVLVYIPSALLSVDVERAFQASSAALCTCNHVAGCSCEKFPSLHLSGDAIFLLYGVCRVSRSR